MLQNGPMPRFLDPDRIQSMLQDQSALGVAEQQFLEGRDRLGIIKVIYFNFYFGIISLVYIIIILGA